MTARRQDVTALLVPFLLYIVMASMLGDWIIDDAGISYAYARNVAAGHGFISQPGVTPVEGFSNFLWVLLLVPFFKLGGFHPVLTAKCLSALFVLGTFAVMQKTLRRWTDSPWPGFWASCVLALAPPIVIWTTSGLENALMLLLAAWLYQQLVDQPSWWRLKAGAAVALMAMTHPEGVLFLVAGGITVLGASLHKRRELLPTLLEYGSGFGLIFGPFFLFRLHVFGLPWPHTYYAKRLYLSPWEQLFALLSQPVSTLSKLWTLCTSAGGWLGVALVLMSVSVAVWKLTRRQLDRPLAVAVLLMLNAIAAYLWLDEDWMGEFRFATVAILGIALAGFIALWQLPLPSPRRSFALAGAVILAGFVWNGVPRMVRFGQEPPTPYADVSAQTARRFTTYAEELGLKNASILVADVGATLFESRLRVYDLAGLCEPDVVRTLKEGTQYWLFQHPKFNDYVFETIKPTFISTRKFWTYVAALERDGRFRRDYVAIDAFEDPYVLRTYGVSLRSGDFVRRDALPQLTRLTALRRPPLAAPRSESWVSRWLGAPANTVAELERAVLRNPADPATLRAWATALDDNGRSIEARTIWAQLLRISEEKQDRAAASAARARLGDGRPGNTMGDALDSEMQRALTLPDPEALTLFDQLLDVNPSHYGAQYQQARVLSRLRRDTEARAAWTTVLELATAQQDETTRADAERALSMTK